MTLLRARAARTDNNNDNYYDCSGTTSRAPSGTNSCVGSGLCFGFPGCDTPHYYYTGSPACGVS